MKNEKNFKIHSLGLRTVIFQSVRKSLLSIKGYKAAFYPLLTGLFAWALLFGWQNMLQIGLAVGLEWKMQLLARFQMRLSVLMLI